MNSQPYSVTRIRRALVHFAGGRVVQASARAILLIVLVRLLPVEDYGAYMLLVGLSEMMLIMTSFGIVPVGRRYIPEMSTKLPAEKLKRFIVTLTLLQAVSLCLVTLGILYGWTALAPWMGFSPEQVTTTRQALWLFLLVPAFRFTAEMLEALMEQGRAQIARALMPTGRVVGIGSLLLLGVQVELPVIIIVDIVITAFCLLLAYSMLRKSLRDLPAPESTENIPVREMMRFGWHMAAVNLLGTTSQPGAIRLVLANSLGIVESGLFAFLQSLQRLVGRYLPGTLLRGIIRPVLVSRAFKPGGMHIVEAGAGLLFKSNLLIVGAGSVVIAVGGDALVSWLSGGKFPQAGLTLLLIFLSLAITAQRNVIDMVMQIVGHTAALRAISVIGPLTLLAVWLFAHMGLNVAVLIIAFGTALSNWIAMSVLVRSATGFNVDWRGLAAIVIPAGTVIVLGMLMATRLSWFMAAGIVLVLFAFSLWLSKPVNTRELSLVERVAGGKAAGLMGVFANRKNA